MVGERHGLCRERHVKPWPARRSRKNVIREGSFRRIISWRKANIIDAVGDLTHKEFQMERPEMLEGELLKRLLQGPPSVSF